MAAMESYAARLASFNAVHPQTKKRTSDARGGKALKWPHKSPSPPRLARAGFFYQPTSSCPDNTTCYLCHSNLDGWEADDSPIEEHLKHAPLCGWAITAATEQDIEGGYHIEDPMSAKMWSARQMTFNTRWPHENKRGWTCKTHKMVDAGWHYCPTLESDDFVRCSYCSLSLDGWEPKDNPYDEHQRRSPDCAFFTYSAPKSKTSRGKKTRPSTVSRLSIQSTFTAMSEGTSIVETEDKKDETNISTEDDYKPAKSTRSGKKSTKAKRAPAKAKGKSAKVRQEESQIASSFLEPEDDDFEVKVTPQPKPEIERYKRKSEQISSADEDTFQSKAENEAIESQQPPRKKRATRARNSVAPPQEVPVALLHIEDSLQNKDLIDAHMTDHEDTAAASRAVPRKKGRGNKTRGSSSARKISTASTASKASLRAPIADDNEIDAAIEADLDKPLTDDEDDVDSAEAEKPKSRRLTRTRPGSKNATASVAPTRRGTRASTALGNDASTAELYPSLQDLQYEEPMDDVTGAAKALLEKPESPPEAKVAGANVSRKVSKKASMKPQDRTGAEENIPAVEDLVAEEHSETTHPRPSKSRQVSRQLHTRKTRALSTQGARDIDDQSALDTTVLDAPAVGDDSGHDTDASVVKHDRVKRGSNAPHAAKKSKAGKKSALISDNTKDVEETLTNVQTQDNSSKSIVTAEDEKNDVQYIVQDEEEKQSEKTKSTKPTVKGRPKKAAAKVKNKGHKADKATKSEERPGTSEQTEDPPARSAPPSVHSTPRPALSPQSSDAENQPPSSRPSITRPLLAFQSPSKSRAMRVPLAVTTPTASPSRGNFSKLQTSCPWTAIDLEQIFSGSPSINKENNSFVLQASNVKGQGMLSSPERRLTVEQWIHFNSQKGEERLRNECERLVGKFESQGMRALQSLQGIVISE